MYLHQVVLRVLLLGVKLDPSPPPPMPALPAAVLAIRDAIGDAHRRFDERAVVFGYRYRSGFWAIYLLSAIAVLCAVLPLALGWDTPAHRLHPYAGLWAVTEVLVIGSVSLIYWRGHRRDWQGQWLRARTTAELAGYLPLVAPLLDFAEPAAEPNWYLRAFNPGQHLRGAEEITALCVRTEPLARRLFATAWADPAFVTSYGRWAVGVLDGQRHYHRAVALRQHALSHRVHRVNGVLFASTAVGALCHLLVHTLWLSLVTTFFPALGASLHGALAQSEAYRLAATSERLAGELTAAIERIRAAIGDGGASPDPAALGAAIRDAIALLLEEHQDWHQTVRPHHLPLA